MSNDSISFGRFEIRPERRQLLVDGEPVVVGSRAFDVLWALVERRGRLVPKQELFDVAWRGVHVEENNLAVQISALRKLLWPACIDTVPGRGYRFVPPCEASPAPAGTGTAPPSVGSALAGPDLQAPRMTRAGSPLYGRRSDLARLAAAVDASRLVTLTGPGGVGKSHLAQHLLNDRSHRDGASVAWAELAHLPGQEFIVATLAAAAGVSLTGIDPLVELVAALRPCELLLCIDNAEHVDKEVGRVAEALLAGAPRVSLLVTSQAPLRHPQERIVRLGPLACAPPDVELERALAYGAVELFVRRAQEVDMRFQLHEQNVVLVADICRRVDGLPLAIELAAARTPLLRLAGLAAMLSDPLGVLASERRSLDPRHRALRTTLEWSHGLMAERERAAFRRLAVFSGSCSLAMARLVLVDGDAPAHAAQPQVEDGDAALAALTELVARSLVESDDNDPPRFRLIETTRAYASECLDAAGERRVLQERHARVVTATFVEADRALSAGSRTRDDTIELLWPEIDNARAALAWALVHARPLALTLVPIIGGLFRNVLFAEVRDMWDATLPFVHDGLPVPTRARWAAGYAFFWANRHLRRSLHWSGVAVELQSQLDDPPALLHALYLFASAKARSGLDGEPELDRIRAIDTAGLPLAVRFMQTFAEAVMATFARRLEVATGFYDKAREMSAVMGDAERHFSVSSNLIDIEMALGRLDDAVRHGEELVKGLRGGRLREYLAVALLNLAAALIARGSTCQARDAVAEGLPLAADHSLTAEWADHLALLAAQQQRFRDAARLLGYGDARHEERDSTRTGNEASSAARADALARAHLDDARLDSERQLGRALDDAQMIAIGLAGA